MRGRVKTVPEPDWRLGTPGVDVLPAMERKRLSFAAAVVAGLACSGAMAQEAVEQRIDGVFEIIPQNSLELAIPLSRRVLMERAREGDETGALFYAAPEAPSHGAPPETQGPSYAVAGASESDDVEEGSAEDFARMPRPRPSLAVSDAAIAIDLVAGAALPVPDDPSLPEEAAEHLPTPDGPLNLAVAQVGESAAAMDAVAAQAAPADTPVPQALLAAAAEAAAARSAGEAAGQPEVFVRDLTASGACLKPGDVTDPDDDFGRNADILAGAGFCIAEQRFREQRRPWTIQTVASGRPGPLWAVMHDDEDIAFDNAVHALAAYGGTLIAMETGGRRNQDGIDPNRNFSAGGIGCSKLGNSAAPEFTAAFRRLFNATQPIIALHNNPDGPIPTGGVGHVTMEAPPRGMRVLESRDPDSPLADEHSLVLLTAVEPIPREIEARGESLAAKGVNVIIEPVSEGQGDCSLSNYAVLSGHPAYLNVTVDDDAAETQRRIIDIIMRSPGSIAASL